MKRLWLTGTMGLGLVLMMGCQHPSVARFDPYLPSIYTVRTTAVTNGITPDLLRPPSELFRLGPGDRLEIELLDDLNSRTLTTVGPDGKIYFNLLPGLDVWGLTLAETKTLLEKEFAKFIRDQPQLSLTLRAVESRHVWLLGRLQNPGVYPLATPTTLLEAISLAGGTQTAVAVQLAGAFNNEELADLRRSFVMRKGRFLPVDFRRLLTGGDLSQNIYLEPGDFVYLPSATARDVYVMGAVSQPRLVPFAENMSLLTAIASSFGTLRDAYLSHVAIVRGSLAQPEIAIVDYNDIIHGRTPDVMLEPRDIVYVPYSPYRILTRYADLILSTFATSVAINEGTRVIQGKQSSPTGVFIPLGSGIKILGPASTGR